MPEPKKKGGGKRKARKAARRAKKAARRAKRGGQLKGAAPPPVAVAAQVIAGIVVMPPTLDLSANFQFTIKLASAPTCKVTVYIEAETVAFDRCQIIFTPENWNQEQRLSITQVPFFDARETKLEFPGKCKLCSDDKNFHNKEAPFIVKRNQQIGATCASVNDPHMKSFDGKKIEMHAGGGPFYMVKSSFLTVQLQTAKCGARVTCNTGVAVRYGNALYVRRGLHLTVTSPPANNCNVRVLTVNGGGHILQLSDGTRVRINGFKKNLISSVHIDIAGHARGQVQGVCGNFNGNPGDDNLEGGGNQLGKHWLVPPDDNLFQAGMQATSIAKAVVYQRTVTCKIPPICVGTGEGPEALPGTTVINKIPKTTIIKEIQEPIKIKEVVKVDVKVKELAIKMCKTVFIDPAANKLVDPQPFIENCLIDAEATDSLAFIEVMKQSYLTMVRTKITVPTAITDPVIQKIAIEVTVNDGLMKAKCPNDCSKRGECTPHGCTCKQGFTGVSCEQQIPIELTIIPTVEKKPPPIQGSVIKIDVTQIDIKETDVGQKFTVVLPSPPSDQVNVFMELPGFLFSRPSVSFDVTNWNKPQTVIINQIPYFNTKKGIRNLKLNLRTGSPQDPRFHDKKIEIPVIRQGGIGSTTIVLNHPHITTFDKLQIDVMESGTYTLMESPSLTVQIIIQQINEKVAVTRSLAFRYGKTVYIFDGKLGLRKASAGSEGVEIIGTKSRGEIRFQLSDGTTIKVQRTDDTISVEIQAAPRYRTKTTGISGNFDDNKDNDLTAPDGNVIKLGPKKILWPDGGEFAKTWVVKTTNNLFACGAVCPDYQKAVMEINAFETTIPITLEGDGRVTNKPEGYTVISSVERYVVQVSPPEKLKVVIKAPTLKPGFEEESQNICGKMFVNEEANKLVDPKPFIDACLADSRATGTFSFTDEIKVNYFNTVRMNTRSMVIDPNSDTKIAITIETNLGLGSAKCPQGCSGRGECRACGCKCQEGFTGLGCEIKITTITTFIRLPPPTIEFKIVTGALKIEQTEVAGDGAERPPTTLVEQAALEGKPLPKPCEESLGTVATATKNAVFPTVKGEGGEAEGGEEGGEGEGGEAKGAEPKAAGAQPEAAEADAAGPKATGAQPEAKGAEPKAAGAAEGGAAANPKAGGAEPKAAAGAEAE